MSFPSIEDVPRVSPQLQISRSTAWRMLEADNRYPCHYMPQGLSSSDLEMRLQFSIVPTRTNGRRHFLFKNMYYGKAMLTKRDLSDFHNNTGVHLAVHVG